MPATAHGRRTMLRLLAILVGGGILLALVAFLLFRSDPSWYRRVQLTEAQQAAAQQRLLDRLATLRNEVGRSQAMTPGAPAAAQPNWPTFDVELSEDEVNSLLMRWSLADPNVAASLKFVEEPHIRFLRDRIELAGRSTEFGSIVSIRLSVSQTAEGPRVHLGRPWAGRLPLSRSLVEEPGMQAVADLRTGRTGNVPSAVVDALEGLVRGDEVAPIILVPSSVQGQSLLPARVEKLAITDGLLKATLRPINAAP